MLKLKYLFENYDLAKECLKLYDADDRSLDKLLTYFRISSNAIYPFRSSSTGKVCVLRLSPIEEKPETEVSSEIQLINWLIERGFPAMKPYPMRDGRLCAVVETAWGTYNVSCFEKVSGETLEDCDGSLELIWGYGRTLGQLHEHMKRYPYAETRRDHAALMDEIRRRFTAYNAPAALLTEWESVDRELAGLPITPECYGVVHYDFEADNVLYCDETDTYGVIDFDDAIRCWYTLDLTRAIDCLDDVAEDVPGDAAQAAFLSGYREVCPFTQEQEATMPLMRRLVRLQEYATILHVLSEPPDFEPEWMTEIIANLRHRLRMIENSI